MLTRLTEEWEDRLLHKRVTKWLRLQFVLIEKGRGAVVLALCAMFELSLANSIDLFMNCIVLSSRGRSLAKSLANFDLSVYDLGALSTPQQNHSLLTRYSSIYFIPCLFLYIFNFL